MAHRRAVIIGGGPAGSVTGFHLARAGFEVTIVERAVFPRVKVCGEFISPAATALLEAVVDAPALRAAGARRVDQFVLELGERRCTWELPEPAWALSRSRLDHLLLEKARAAGAAVLQPAPVHTVEYTDRSVSIILADGRRLDGDLVIHADGSGRHDPAGPVPHDPHLTGHKCHLRIPGEAIKGVRIRAGAGAYVGTIAVEDGLATCALAARKSLTAHYRGDIDAMVRALWPGYDPARRVSEWKSCGVARSRYVNPGHPRSFRVGNSAAAVDPIGGEGIGLAVWAGTVLAGLLAPTTGETTGAATGVACPQLCVGTSSESLAHVQREFSSLYARRLRTRLPACRLAAQLLMRPRLLAALWPLLAVPSLSVRPWYALTGKPNRSIPRAGMR